MFPKTQLSIALFGAALFLVAPCRVARAEAAPPAGGTAIVVTTPQKAPEPSVFDLESKNPAPKASKGSSQGVERFYGEEPDYNTEQRARWLQICEPKKAVDFNAYRECYENEKQKTLRGLKLNRERVEKRQGQRFRNAGSIDAEPGPGGGGSDE